jgi:hypothetical protein
VTITAESADGTTHEFPDGTDQAVVDRVMKDYATKGATPPPPAVPPPAATPTKPAPQMPPMQHVASAMGEAFAPPYGVSTEAVFPWVKDRPVLGAVLGLPVEGLSTAVDLMGRPITALTRGAAAAGAEIARASGATPTSQEQIERDLNVAGEGTQIETMRAPSVPKLSVTTDTAGGVKALGQRAARAAQDSPLAGPVAKGLRWLWDVDKTDPEKLATIHDIADKGGRVPIESWAPASTYLARLTAIARGWGYDPVKEAAVPFYERKAGDVLQSAGLPPEQASGLTSATAAAPLAPAGEAAVAKAHEIIGSATDKLNSEIEAFKNREIGPATREAREKARDISTEQTALVTAADEARAQAAKTVQDGFTDINKSLDDAITGPEMQSGDLMRAAEGKLRDLRREVGRYFRKQYDAADTAAEGHLPNTSALAPWAQGLLDAILPPVKAQYPREVELLTKLATEEEPPKPSGLVDQHGQPIMSTAEAPASEITFGQLHELRNWVRHVIDWDDLAAGPKQGVLKLVEREIDRILHDQEASPELKTAAKMLDATDKEYGNVIPRFKDSVVRQIVRSGAAAAPENAAKLASMVITEHNTERIGMVRDMVGPEIWRKVQAADLKTIVAHSLDETGQFDPQAFAKKIMERSNLGMLAPTYGADEAATLVRQAQRVQQTYAKNPDLSVLPGDTVTTLLARADNAIQRAESLAEQDPLGLLKQHVEQINAKAKQMSATGKEQIKANPLNDLLDMESEAAAKKILSDHDLFRSAAQQFGADSPEFTLLRQTWARQFLQRNIERVREMPDEFSKSPEDIQRLLFPGVSLDQMVRLTKEMRIMFPKGEDATSIGMSGMAMLMHPANASFWPSWAKKAIMYLPTAVARGATGIALDKIANIATSPQLMRFVTKGLTGTPIQQDAAKVVMFSVMAGANTTEALAAGSAVLAGEMANPDQEPQDGPVRKRKPWQEMLRGPQVEAPWMKELQQGAQP